MTLDILNLTKKYNNQIVLDNLNLDIKNIHSLVIIGPSGGGKSTLLKVIAGLVTPETGTVRINNKNLSFEEKYLEKYRKTIGIVFQSYNLFPHLTALENIILPLEKIHGFPKDESYKKALNLLEKFQLLEHMNKKPKQLSGGQQQRVAIIRMLALDSEFLLLDEPTSALDPYLVSEVLDTIMELKKEKKDLILVTHQMSFAKAVGDYLIYVDKGKIIEQGNPKEVLESPKSEELKFFLSKILKY
ncbi:amino acid ABC transporter ATP-binding protein [Cetobacterium sp. 2A]|uniref:amino acid ABC transporter ATP-binding protein n=1 Tax=Cetobacterium sp. 2A TaxID=2754723 RepID=UPI00163BCA53|nr:amino acid ABC transporter ATP-binding protein [Cetobacterium sp. 2A]MBC2854992.1 amino acid ABC transporter ATP-binding protein [Cetobacterium sp. 2A]